MGIGFADYGLERFQITPLIIRSSELLQEVIPTPTVSAKWPVANLAMFVPFTLSEMVVIKRMIVLVGTGTGGNIDVGLYDANGNRLVSSGSTLLETVSRAQFFDIADIQLNAGRYYMAEAENATTPYLGYATDPGWSSMLGVREMAAAFPLPATATFTDNVVRSFFPLLAVTLTAA